VQPLTCGAIGWSPVHHVHGRRWLSVSLIILTASVLSLNALTQIRPRGQVRGSSAVGVLMLRGRHPFCTASIVDSPRGNLILTAAHCLGRRIAPTLMFAPYYDGHRAPLGEWRVTGQIFPPGWRPYGNVNEDFAFLTVTGDVQARAGAEQVGFSSPVPSRVRVEAYSFSGALTVCTRRPGTITEAGQPQLSFACPGFAGASSGGPFLIGIHGRAGLGTVVGVIGGYQRGGITSVLSYSSPFGMVLHRLYAALTRQSNLALTITPAGLW
jgi:hypothetical protein